MTEKKWSRAAAPPGARCRGTIMPMSDRLEVRIAHKGAYEQVDRRLGSIESTLMQFRSELTGLTGRMDSQFHWLLGTIFTSWITLLLAIFFRN